jgi:hypothetical protein
MTNVLLKFISGIRLYIKGDQLQNYTNEMESIIFFKSLYNKLVALNIRQFV